MSSSQDRSRNPGSVTPFELTELRPGTAAAVATAEVPVASAAIPFEVGTSAGVPESLLAPARAAARAAGYAAGWAHGVRMAEERAAAAAQQARAELEQLLAEQRAAVARGLTALHAAADALERQAVPGAEQLEALLLDAGYGIAEALVGHSLRDTERRAPAALARALSLAPVGEPVSVRLHPDDHAVLADHLDAVSADREVTLVPDATLSPGDAVALSGATEVDARIRAGLDRIRDALGRA